MLRIQAVILFLLMGISAVAQKKPLDHSAYDSWQSIGEKLVSADGRFITYVINLQEGDGELVIREGLNTIKNVGEKAAEIIETERKKNGPYQDLDDFLDRVPKRNVNSRVVDALIKEGALEFNEKVFLKRVTKYNSTLYAKGCR